MYRILLFACLILCGSKVEFTDLIIQREFPGIKTGSTIIHINGTISNPKEKNIEINEFWFEGDWHPITRFSSKKKTIIFKYDIAQKHSEEKPSRKNKEGDVAVIKYSIKGKQKSIGIKNLKFSEPIARP